MCTINKSAHTKKVWKLIVCTSYIYIYIYMKDKGKKFLHSRWDDDGSRVRYPTDVKSLGFRSLLEASSGSTQTKELWYDETVWLWMTIYIYIYIYISSCPAISMDIPDPLSPPLPIVHAFGRSSGQHPVSVHSCCMLVWAGRPAFARSCEGVYRSTSLMSSSLLL